MTDAEYLDLKAANWSTIQHFRRSPAHVKWHMENDSISTESLSLGSLQHAVLLEPDAVEGRFAVLPEITWNSKASKAETVKRLVEREMLPPDAVDLAVGFKRQELLDYVAYRFPKQLVSQEIFERCRDISRAVWGNPIAAKLLMEATHKEKVASWKCRETGAPCKGRVDAYIQPRGFLIDIKTTRDASFYAFRSAIERYGYVCQVAHYRAGLIAAGHDVNACIIIAVENEPPYGVAIYNLINTAISAAEVLVKDYLAKWVACTQTDYWPSYNDEPQDIDLSESGYRRLEVQQ